MKIYRAILCYNNADTCEWERWYTETSKWYSDKVNAEKNLPELEELLKYLKDNVYNHQLELFKFEGPYIEEAEIQDNFVPLNINYNYFR